MVDDFGDFHKEIEALKGRASIFRGLSKSHYDLTPRAGRETPFVADSVPEMEKRLLSYFKESALPHLDRLPRSELEWLALAQHHGLATRLMDWTYNPLVALYFAVEKDHDCDAAIWVLEGEGPPKDQNQQDPFGVENVRRYRPPHVSARIATQQGLFTVHGDPTQPLQHEGLSKIVIAASARRGLKKVLFKYGVSRRHLFPGLDGIAEDLLWLETKRH